MARRHHSINLIPPAYRQSALPSMDHALLAAMAFVLILGAVFSTAKYAEVRRVRVQIEQTFVQHGSLDNQIVNLRKLLTDNTARAEQQSLVSQVIGAKFHWAEIFKELSLVIPNRTWLTELYAQNNGGQLAIAVQGQTVSQAHMATFYAALERSVHFNRVLVVSSKMSDQTQPPLYQFEFATPGLHVKGRTPGSSK